MIFIFKQKEPELEFGGVYTAKILEIVPGGLMVQFYNGMKPALLPNSQLDGRKIGKKILKLQIIQLIIFLY